MKSITDFINESKQRPYCEYDGKKYGETGVRKLLLKNVEKGNDIKTNIKKLIDWCVDNFSVKHDVVIVNAISELVYNDWEVYNTNLDKYINNTVQDLVNQGKIDSWIFEKE